MTFRAVNPVTKASRELSPVLSKAHIWVAYAKNIENSHWLSTSSHLASNCQ